MHVVVATDSFKGSLRAAEVAARVAKGLREAWPALRVRELPLSDGGEGLVECLLAARGGRRHSVTVTGPQGAPVEAVFVVLPDGATAVLEMAAASGLGLVPPGGRDPWTATTRGTGELIRAALDAGARRLLIGVGGSATHDGGAGMARALGARLADAAGRDVPPGAAGLRRLAAVDLSGLDRRLSGVEVLVAHDVDNPLCGSQGAIAYASQKGAAHSDLPALDAALAQLAGRVEAVLPAPPGADPARYRHVPGAGAAGGLGFGLAALLGARMRPGARLVLEAVGADALFRAAQLVVTGEGRMDASTLRGKLPLVVARAACDAGARVLAVCGDLRAPAALFRDAGIEAIYPLPGGPASESELSARAADLAEATGHRIGRALRLGHESGDG